VAVACDKPPRQRVKRREEKEEEERRADIYLDYYSRLEDFGLLRLDY